MNISGRSDRKLKEKFVGTIQLSCEKNIYAYTVNPQYRASSLTP